VVLTDFNFLQVCDSKTLEPKRLLTYGEIDKDLSGMGICAHPPKDRVRGEIYNYLISRDGKLWIFAMNYTTVPAKVVWKAGSALIKLLEGHG
jgi:torulene dioxygenase